MYGVKQFTDVTMNRTCNFYGQRTPEEIKSLNASYGDQVIVIGIPDVEKEVNGIRCVEEGVTLIDGITVRNLTHLIKFATWQVLDYYDDSPKANLRRISESIKCALENDITDKTYWENVRNQVNVNIDKLLK